MFKDLIDTILSEELSPEEELDAMLNSEEPPTDVEDPQEKSEDAEIADDVEEELENKKPLTTARVFSFDKEKINQQLSELTNKTTTSFPVGALKEILSSYELTIIRNSQEFQTDDGDEDYELFTTDNKVITNSALTVQWHKREDGGFNFNCYLT